MTLDEFLYKHRLTLREFAEMIGFAPSYVSQVKNGHKRASPRMIYTVTQVTNGEVDISKGYKKNG